MTITQELIKNSQPHWDEYIQHEFIQKLAAGTLVLENFQHYLMQIRSPRYELYCQIIT